MAVLVELNIDARCNCPVPLFHTIRNLKLGDISVMVTTVFL
jgi:hypothetical protein